MAQIIPAILEETKEGFLDKVSRVVKLPGLKRVQVDFGDGQFIDKRLLSAAAMDLNPAFEWEAHLMIKQPADFLDYKIAGFSIVLLHYEAFDNSRDLHKAIDEVKAQGLKAGLVLNPGTPIEVSRDFEKILSQILLMGVQPGRQGQEFIPKIVEKVSALRKLLPNAIIEVDGGVNLDNIKPLSQAGADLLVVGSALLKAPNMSEVWTKMINN